LERSVNAYACARTHTYRILTAVFEQSLLEKLYEVITVTWMWKTRNDN